MVISHLSPAVRYTGRWAQKEDVSVTTAPGAMLEVAFCGSYCELMFAVKMNAEPFPHVYIQVDDGARVETRIEHYMRVEAPEAGNHVVRVIYKSAMEDQQRWYEPLTGKVSFIGADAEAEGVLPEDTRKIIEFVGDSVTEGVWVDEPKMPYGNRSNHRNMVFQNDATATYAYLTAEGLGMRPYIMGYGGEGITKGGGGGVPKVYEAYPYCFAGQLREASGAEIIVINHGANDMYKSAEEYVEGYEVFLDLVREINPNAKVVAMSAFYGVYVEELRGMVEAYNESRKTEVFFIDTSGWIPKHPMHPTREGHKTVAEKLIPILKEKFLEE